jgi:hypothetical protein
VVSRALRQEALFASTLAMSSSSFAPPQVPPRQLSHTFVLASSPSIAQAAQRGEADHESFPAVPVLKQTIPV